MNAITHARTSRFRIIPELHAEFDAFVNALTGECEAKQEWDIDGQVALLDVADLNYFQNYDEDAEEILDNGLAELMRFVAPGQAVCYVYAGYTGQQWVGGGATIGMKDDNGDVHFRYVSTHDWLKDQVAILSHVGFQIAMPVS